MCKFSSTDWQEWVDSLPEEGWGGRTPAEWTSYNNESMQALYEWILELPKEGMGGYSRKQWKDSYLFAQVIQKIDPILCCRFLPMIYSFCNC
mgnify:CR=1 FL=1